MSLVQSGLTAKLTQAALSNAPATIGDLVELCKVVTVNAQQLIVAQQRISELEALMVSDEPNTTTDAANNEPTKLVDVVISFSGYDSTVKVPEDQVEEFLKLHNGN